MISKVTAKAKTHFLKGCALATAAVFLLPSIVNAQSTVAKREGRIVCGSFSGDPKKYPAWNDTLSVEIKRNALIATPSRPQGQILTGVVAPSGAVLLAGEGGVPGQPPEWTYEFSGQLNSKGKTVLRGSLANIFGGGATRSCAITF
jgi:hypothetical protein